MSVEQINVAELHKRFTAQGVSEREDIAFKCIRCGTIQSGRDFMRATGKTFDEIERWLGFSCIGRFTNAGPHKDGTPRGRGCDWTLGGLFSIHNLVVIDDDGVEHPTFAVASPEEAQNHAARNARAA